MIKKPLTLYRPQRNSVIFSIYTYQIIGKTRNFVYQGRDEKLFFKIQIYSDKKINTKIAAILSSNKQNILSKSKVYNKIVYTLLR